MFSAQKKILSFVFLFLAGLLVFLGWMFVRRSTKELPPQALSPPIVTPPTSSTPYVQTGTTAVMKTYRNIEFSFEFRYPENWSFHPGTFYSPFSKFNLVGASPEEKGHPDPLAPSMMINVVTPDFAERATISMRNLEFTKSSAVVAAIKGTKYTYTFEGRILIDVIIPLKSTVIIFETDQRYEEIFNQILTSFKFLK